MDRTDVRYRLMIEHASDVVFTTDLEGRLDWVSPSIRKLTGVPPEELLGTHLTEFVTDTDADLVASQIDAVQRGEEAEFVGRVARPDGGPLWVAARAAALRDDDGAIIGAVGTVRDVDALVRAQGVALAKQEQLRATLDTLFDPHVLLQPVRNQAGVIIDFVHLEASRAACEYNGRTRDELIGKGIRELAPPSIAGELVRMLASVVDTGEPLVLEDFEFPDRSQDMVVRRFDVRAASVGDCVVQTWRDVTEQHNAKEHLSHLATHDPLTGLANRASLLGELELALHTVRRSGLLVAVLMLDLDHFKDVNDEHGHLVGDQLLKAAARRLERQVRGGDLVCRLGGDEFVIVMRDLEDSSEAMRVAARIVDEFKRPEPVAGFELRTTTSVGVAISTPESTPEDLLREADTAMYRAKEGGRDRSSVFNDDLRVALLARSALESQLRPALDLGELAVYYQPEVDLQSGAVVAVEALLRWHHPSGELYSADRFIDVAEEMGVLVEGGDWLLREACAAAAAWARLRPERPLMLRINLSKQQLAEHGMGSAFERALVESCVSAASVCVEIAESALIRPSSAAHDNLGHLAALGVNLAIDNFGTGYAALAFLRERPIDVVKIDRSFINDVDGTDHARRLVAGISALARQMGLHVAAEGVETLSQVRVLRELGCASAQGFLFSPAVPADQVLGLLDRVFPVR